MDIKIVAVDLMGVIFTEAHMVKNGLMKILPHHDYRIVKHFYNLYIVGQISRDEFWSRLNVNNFEETEKKFLDLFDIDEEIFDVLEYLKQKYILGIITNHTKEWFDYLDKKFGFCKFFSIVIISSEVKEKKPNSNIFEKFLEEANINGREVCFIDDKLENLKTVSRLGMTTIWMKREDQKATLNQILLLQNFSN